MKGVRIEIVAGCFLRVVGRQGSLATSPQKVFDPFGRCEQPLQAGGMFAQLFEFLGGAAVHTAVRTVPGAQVAGAIPNSAATFSSVLPYTVSSSARRNLRRMASAECRVRPAIHFIFSSRPTSGHRTVKSGGLIQGEQATPVGHLRLRGPMVFKPAVTAVP